MAKDKRLTKEQCKALSDIMHAYTRKLITEVLKFASEHDGYDPTEVKIFIKNYFEAVVLLSDSLVDTTAREIIRHGIKEVTEKLTQVNKDLINNIDFPNSDKNSENKSSDTKNTER